MEQDWQRFRDSFEKFVIQDLKKALRADVEVGTIVLTAVGIECLSGYFVGKKSDDKTFKSFIDKFMPMYSSHAVTLYKCIRNGLAHDYIIKEDSEGKSFLFTRNRGEKHLIPVESKHGWFYLNREQFALDFLKAQNDFFNQVESDKTLFEKAMGRLNKAGFLEVFSFHPTTIFVDPNSDSHEHNGVTGTFPQRH